jgi:hypothetical protein
MDIDTAKWTQVGSKKKAARSNSPSKLTSKRRMESTGSRDNPTELKVTTQIHDDVQNKAANPNKVANTDESSYTNTEWETDNG